jgi:hypothetical protein
MKIISILTPLILLLSPDCISQKLKHDYDILYGKANTFQNVLQDLKLDLTYLKGDKKLPLIVMIHGGGFFKGSKEDHRHVCDELGKKGFIVANLEYRQGFDRRPEAFIEGISLAVYRAQQDAAAAMRFLVHNADEYHIDTSLIFIGGESAGSVTALGRAYISQNEWDHGLSVLKEKLGSIDSSGNNLQDKYRVKGVFSMWGGIPDTAMISQNELQSIPVLLIHSMDDEQIGYEQSTHPYVLYPTLQGAYDIAQRFKNNNGCYVLNYIEGARHAYGFSQQFVVNAISDFIKNVIAGTCTSQEKEIKGDIMRSYLEYDR